jgi:diguanylate cyclase (GGDEF)-like protein
MIINSLSSTFISSADIDKVLADLLQKVLLITDFSIGWIMVRDKKRYSLNCNRGISSDLLNKIKDGALEELITSFTGSFDPLCILEKDQISKYPLLKREGVAFVAIVPLFIADTVYGVFFLASRSERRFDFDLASMMTLMGHQISLILEKVRLFEETKRLSITDSLTGLYNIRYFYRALESENARSKRYSYKFSLLMFDIDDFKVINDTYGHQVGDDVLREVASILLESSRETDIVARYGGEEFVTILPDSSKEEAFTLADRIRQNICDHAFLMRDKGSIRISISGGVATFPEDGQTAEELLHNSDLALYDAKRRGKKQVVSYMNRCE